MQNCKFFFVMLFFAVSCTCPEDSKKERKINKPEITIWFYDSHGRRVPFGSVAIFYPDLEENSMNIVEDSNRMIKVDSEGKIVLNKSIIAKEYRVKITDSLSAFHWDSLNVTPFTINLNNNEISVFLREW